MCAHKKLNTLHARVSCARRLAARNVVKFTSKSTDALHEPPFLYTPVLTSPARIRRTFEDEFSTIEPIEQWILASSTSKNALHLLMCKIQRNIFSFWPSKCRPCEPWFPRSISLRSQNRRGRRRGRDLLHENTGRFAKMQTSNAEFQRAERCDVVRKTQQIRRFVSPNWYWR